ncbi:hypothetical protein [Puerhibacterium puerhi]|uniref:hypothetical protein n=1 Tax=Puerhibacterium puerhi TaxID=2692623 RepID=UPI0019155120|nr:hypothetical protein [Puerhibacterium puerhi]
MLDAVLITVGCVAAIVAIDRLALRAEAKGWIYWRHTRPKPDGGAVLGELVEAFQPSTQLTLQEKQRLEAGAERANPGDVFDLSSGRVVLYVDADRPTR